MATITMDTAMTTERAPFCLVAVPDGRPLHTFPGTALYKLMTWLSPAFPVGGFSYSHGLEWAGEDGAVRDEASLQQWIEAGLAQEFRAVWALAQLRAAHAAVTAHDADALRAAIGEARAWQPTREFALESLARGGRHFSPPCGSVIALTPPWR